MTKALPTTRPAVVHIGMPKTATKTLQWRLFALHSDIFYLGRFDGPSFKGKYHPYAACRDADVFRIMDRVAYKNVFDVDIEQCQRWLGDYLRDNNPLDKLTVWSWESYCTDSFAMRQQRAKNLKRLLGEAKILVSIRHPVRLLESAYLQQLKRDNIGGYYKRGKGPFIRKIDDWVAFDYKGDISNHLDYPRTIRAYVEEFGAENVCVVLYEQLVDEPELFWKTICDFMEINYDEAMQLLTDADDNTRWTEIQLQQLQAIRKSSWKSLVFRFASKPIRKAMLDLYRNGTPRTPVRPARASISPPVQAEILQRTLEGNRWLEKTFALDLAGRGYMRL